jgi:hypothetical protein
MSEEKTFLVEVDEYAPRQVEAPTAEVAALKWHRTLFEMGEEPFYGITFYLTVGEIGGERIRYNMDVPELGVRRPPTLTRVGALPPSTQASFSWQDLRERIFAPLAAEVAAQKRAEAESAARLREEEFAYVREKIASLPEKLLAAYRAKGEYIPMEEFERRSPRLGVRIELYREACAALGLSVEVEYPREGTGYLAVTVPDRKTIERYVRDRRDDDEDSNGSWG